MRFKGNTSEKSLYFYLICYIWITLIDICAAYKGEEEANLIMKISDLDELTEIIAVSFELFVKALNHFAMENAVACHQSTID